MNSVKIVEEFWERVWKARDPAAIDDFVVEDFVITTSGKMDCWFVGVPSIPLFFSAIRHLEATRLLSWVERSSFELFQQLRSSHSIVSGPWLNQAQPHKAPIAKPTVKRFGLVIVNPRSGRMNSRLYPAIVAAPIHRLAGRRQLTRSHPRSVPRWSPAPIQDKLATG